MLLISSGPGSSCLCNWTHRCPHSPGGCGNQSQPCGWFGALSSLESLSWLLSFFHQVLLVVICSLSFLPGIRDRGAVRCGGTQGLSRLAEAQIVRHTLAPSQQVTAASQPPPGPVPQLLFASGSKRSCTSPQGTKGARGVVAGGGCRSLKEAVIVLLLAQAFQILSRAGHVSVSSLLQEGPPSGRQGTKIGVVWDGGGQLGTQNGFSPS